MINRLPEIYSLFEQNRFATAFYGDSTFILKDKAWGLGDHNSLGMFMHYIRWAAMQNNYDSSSLKEFLLLDLRTNRSLNKITKILAPIFLLRSYCIAATTEKQWPLTQDEVLEVLSKIKQFFNEDETRLYNIKQTLITMEKYIPGISNLAKSL